MAEYATAIGFVQFEPNLREANGTEVRDITVKMPGLEGALVRVTLWDQFAEAEVEQGDFVAVDGKVNIREVDGKTYINLDATKLAVNGAAFKSGEGAPAKEREVVGQKSTTKRF